MKGEKAISGNVATFLGLEGRPHRPQAGMHLLIDLTPGKKQLWADRIRFFIDAGRIQANELESLAGRLSFSQTSARGRYGGLNPSAIGVLR